MKRGLCFCLMIAVIFTMVMIPVNAADDWAKIEIQTPTELPKAGEEFEVVAIIEGTGPDGLLLDLFAENESVECTKIVLGEMVNTEHSVTNILTEDGKFRAGGLFKEKLAGRDVFATYTLRAKEALTAFDLKSESTLIFYYATFEPPVKQEDVVDTPDIPEDVVDLPEIPDDNAEVIPEEPFDAEEKEEETPVVESLYADTEGHWSESYINTATEMGLFKGDEKGFFNPDHDVTRAQFVTVLWRMAGSPAADAENVPFADIKEQSQEFKTAIAWGYNNGYINGTSKTTFEPDGNLTREAAVKILHAYSGGQSGMELVFAFVYDGHFKDSNLISNWARPSVYWGIYNKMLSGTSEDTISPQGTATRAQLAKILVNYINTYTN